MMDWTDRHCRAFHRVLTRRAVLYTEMVTAVAVMHGKRERLLGFDGSEHPVVLQLGGSEPDRLARAAEIGAGFGYDAINLNCGCPSDRVQSGRFGACLMAEPRLVADCVRAMRGATGLPVTVKCRIGIDDQDSEADFQRFVETVAGAGCTMFIVHARKAWLRGLSPKENREVPPLDYARVYRLKASLPQLTIVLNGGLADLAAARVAQGSLDGVMLGRAAYQRPWMLAEVDSAFYGDDRTQAPAARSAAIEAYLPYVAARLEAGDRLYAMARHLLGLYHGAPGGRAFRRHLAENAPRRDAGLGVLIEAVEIAESWARKLGTSQLETDQAA
jgi:tRNA-dihydrouridine synthase A